jgi:hypothetical protein
VDPSVSSGRKSRADRSKGDVALRAATIRASLVPAWASAGEPLTAGTLLGSETVGAAGD